VLAYKESTFKTINNLSVGPSVLQPIVLHTEVIDSTNTCLLQDNDYPNGTVLLADYQTAGRGRFGRFWQSPPEEALLFSVLLTDLPDRVPLYTYTFLAATGVYNGLKIQIPDSHKLALKWPNDVLLDQKKVCGILVQSRTNGQKIQRLVIGIGLNVNQPQDFFIGELAQATSLGTSIGKTFDRNDVLKRILKSLDQALLRLKDAGEEAILKTWKSSCDSIGKTVAVNAGKRVYRGIFEDVSANGGLILRIKEKTKVFHAADVTIVKEDNDAISY
jgi:BirA family biotin operon repressor/biotin-[acetyl-CoA-carboxylase] ligase